MSTNHDREQPGLAGDDPVLVHAWRQASDEQPPARLDAAILAAARRSVEVEDAATTHRPVRLQTRSRWIQWQPLAAAATVAGLAFVLVQTIPREREVAPPIRIEAPKAPALEREVAPPVRSDALAVTPTPQVTLESRSSAPGPVVPDAAPPLREGGVAGATRAPAAAAAGDVADTMGNAEADVRKGVVTQAPGEAYSAEAAAPATGPTAARATPSAAPPSGVDWIARIEALHASGDPDGAAAALREFRAADPDADARLPESLREWARTVE